MNNIVRRLKKYIINPSFRFYVNSRVGINSLLPDTVFLKKCYFYKMGKHLDLDNPKTFNEKLQWLKHYDRKDEYTMMVDKYEVKSYIASRIGSEYVIPTIGVWENFDDIDFDLLPDQFVMKCTHDSNGLVICRDKATLNKKAAKKKITKALRSNYYRIFHEWPYKNVKPRIIVENYMEDKASSSLVDYKFFCFNGEPRFLYVSHGLEDHETASISFLNMDWTFAPYERSDYRTFESLPRKPQKYDEMVLIAKKLSSGIPFLRVDLYEINGEIYFSELTFSPCGGFVPFKDMRHDLEIGEMLSLPSGK